VGDTLITVVIHFGLLFCSLKKVEVGNQLPVKVSFLIGVFQSCIDQAR